MKKLLLMIFGILVGMGLGYYAIFYTPLFTSNNSNLPILNPLAAQFGQKEIIGFLPYWLTSQATKDYSKYITQLSYYGLTVDTDGTILKLNNPQEEEPGWSALKIGKLDDFFSKAKQSKTKLSLLVFNGNVDSINQLISKPREHAQNLLKDVIPLMQKYGFTDLNLDLESTSDASDSAQANFAIFVQTVKSGMDSQKMGTVTLDISAIDFVKKKLIDPYLVGNIVDHLVIMAYDYHYIGSEVTGAVAPLFGAGTSLEFDAQTAVEKALEIIPSQKIILGIPLYGYQWETLGNTKQSGIIPGTGTIASNLRVEDLLSSCSTCSAQFDTSAQESYVTYQDFDTKTFHQVFYPDKQSMLAKVKYANSKNLGGVALWALGYEGNSILTPLVDYKNNNHFLYH